MLLYREYINDDDSITYQFVVPKHQRQLVLQQCHDLVFSGHLGYDKTLERIRSRFY